MVRCAGLIAVLAILVISPSLRAETEMTRAVTAKAEKAAMTVRKACEADVKSFCSQVDPGEGHLLLCMVAHEKKVSDKCFTTLLDVADAVELSISSVARAARVCAPDIEKHCPDTEAGEGRIAKCLSDAKSKLSQSCSAELSGIEGRLK
jgi:hypothetical protein